MRESKSKLNELKLKRALESIEKFKSTIMECKSKKGVDDSLHNKEQKDYEQTMNELKQQRDELLVGFKKQMQLIHVLKRQKVHLEASKLLDITEKEFMNVIDWQSNANLNTKSKTKTRR